MLLCLQEEGTPPMVPPCSGESRLAKEGHGKEQPGAWDDSAAMWGG